jgi:hypothetical protein
MSWRRQREGKLAREKIPKSKSVHVQTYARNPVTIVGAIEKHRTSQHCRTWKSQRRTHGDGKSARAATASNGESVEEKRRKLFLVPYYLFAERSNPKKGRNEKVTSYLVVLFFYRLKQIKPEDEVEPRQSRRAEPRELRKSSRMQRRRDPGGDSSQRRRRLYRGCSGPTKAAANRSWMWWLKAESDGGDEPGTWRRRSMQKTAAPEDPSKKTADDDQWEGHNEVMVCSRRRT